MELKDTVNLMLSSDFKDRLVGEYLQVKIRLNSLEAFIKKAQAGDLSFDLNCPIDLLIKQREIMRAYVSVLEERTDFEEFDVKIK